MLEKTPHIKNPLTIIAIFSGIAEVSGTIVLPFLRIETQIIFVWFLIFFPLVLVAAFFWTLWNRNTVLYAPSDYREDKSFIQITHATEKDVEKIFIRELGNPPNRIENLPVKEKQNNSSEELEYSGYGDFFSDSRESYNEKIQIIYDTKERARIYLKNKIGFNFQRNLKILGENGYIFDLGYLTDERIILSDIMFGNSGLSTGRLYAKVESVFSQLPEDQKDNFEYILFIIFNKEKFNQIDVKTTIAIKKEYVSGFLFKTKIVYGNGEEFYDA